MPKQIHIIIAIILSLSLSCSKRNDFVIDLTVKSAYSGVGFSGNVKLKYDTGSEQYLNLGNLVDGKLNVTADIPKSVSTAELQIYIAGEFYSIPGYSGPYLKSISRSSGPIVMEIPPIPRMEFTVKNVNCFDETDSVWVYFLGSSLYEPKLYTGCINENPGNLPIWYTTNTLNFKTISKKNSVYDTLFHEFQTLPEVHHQFTIEY